MSRRAPDAAHGATSPDMEKSCAAARRGAHEKIRRRTARQRLANGLSSS